MAPTVAVTAGGEGLAVSVRRWPSGKPNLNESNDSEFSSCPDLRSSTDQHFDG
jgi:hypothetical protein